MIFGIVVLYRGQSGKKGYYNSQEVGLARAMKRLGYACIIFYPMVGASTALEEKVEENIKIVYVPARAIGTHSWFDWSILKQYHTDIVQIASDTQFAIPSIMKYCDTNNIRCYHYIGTIESDTDNVAKKAIMHLLFKRNLRALRNHPIFVKTVFVKKQLEQHGITHAVVAPVGLDTSIIPQILEDRERLRSVFGISKGERLVLFVGRIDAYKRPFELLELAEMLSENYKFIVIGSGALDADFEKALQEGNLHERIKWFKRIANADIHGYYRAADYFVNFNRNEIFGMSILEAMYQGCTVIANRAPGPEEIIVDMESGYLVDNTYQMAEKIQSGTVFSRDIVRKHIEENFSWDNTAQKVHQWAITAEKE